MYMYICIYVCNCIYIHVYMCIFSYIRMKHEGQRVRESPKHHVSCNSTWRQFPMSKVPL